MVCVCVRDGGLSAVTVGSVPSASESPRPGLHDPYCNTPACTVREYSIMNEVRASQLAQASERVGSPIPASQQG